MKQQISSESQEYLALFSNPDAIFVPRAGLIMPYFILRIFLSLILMLFFLPEQQAAAAPNIKKNPCSKSVPRNKRPKCCDKRDNDKDGLIDYPKDPGCRSKKDKSEKNVLSSPLPPTDIPTGIGVSLKGRRIFPEDNPWNQDISTAPVDPNSDNLIASIGLDKGLHPDFGTFWQGQPIGFPYVVVSSDQKKVPVKFYYQDESYAGPYPIPDTAPIEGGNNSTGDRHILVIDKDNWKLYETYDSHQESDGWSCGSGAIFDLNSNDLRPAGWTSADAAGLPIFPGLVRYDEVVEQGEIKHALRFTVSKTRRAYVSPARHYASSNTSVNLPPMGMRVRLKSSVNISSYPKKVQIILEALKKYGMFVADNGSDWFISGVHDERWDDEELSAIKAVKGRDFEVVEMGSVVTD